MEKGRRVVGALRDTGEYGHVSLLRSEAGVLLPNTMWSQTLFISTSFTFLLGRFKQKSLQWASGVSDEIDGRCRQLTKGKRVTGTRVLAAQVCYCHCCCSYAQASSLYYAGAKRKTNDESPTGRSCPTLRHCAVPRSLKGVRLCVNPLGLLCNIGHHRSATRRYAPQ